MLVSGMARAIYLWLPSLTAFALSACSGSESGFFSNVVTAGTGSVSQAGAPSSSAGAFSSSGSPGSAGTTISPGSAGRDEAGDGSGGAQTGGTGGASSGGASSGGPHSGGTAGSSAGAGAHAGGGAGAHAGAGGSGASAGHAGASSGSAGAAGATQDLSCSELIKLANSQLEAARACDPNAKPIQCTGTVTTTCKCEVPVQKDTSAETKAYLSTLKQINAKNCVQVCTALACSPADNAQCKASGGSDTGSCVSSHGLTL